MIITADSVTKAFTTPDGGALPVLDGVSFTLAEGEIVALLGKSGSGKSTLLRCVAGLIAPSSGSVSYRGTPLTGANPGVSMVFQTFALLPWLTVQQNVELGLEARGVPEAERAERALKAIDTIGLDGFESAYPKELSGGMRQRVGFARAIVTEPDALLMDEPFSALDVLTAENLRGELVKLWEGRGAPVEVHPHRHAQHRGGGAAGRPGAGAVFQPRPDQGRALGRAAAAPGPARAPVRGPGRHHLRHPHRARGVGF